ncbi:MAG: helix-turn-helix transcriptional regulator [Clostridia bacterium]|nr:helix-turn-helix transcriptional regulator [Clostridia bacterium]
MTIGKNIAQLRRDSGMTQEQLAEHLCVSAQSVSKWENETTMPDIMLLPTIAGCFGVTVDELYGGKKPEPACEPVDYDKIPEMLYDSVIDLTNRGWVSTVSGKDIGEENARMKAYLESDHGVKTATFSNEGGAVIATAEIGLIHRGKPKADGLTGEAIGRVLAVLAEEPVRKVFAYETEHPTEFLTAAYASKKCGISREEAEDALEKLTEIHVNYPKAVMVDEDMPLKMYSLDSGEWVMYVLMILKTAKLMADHEQHYYNYRGSYNSLWMK